MSKQVLIPCEDPLRVIQTPQIKPIFEKRVKKRSIWFEFAHSYLKTVVDLGKNALKIAMIDRKSVV